MKKVVDNVNSELDSCTERSRNILPGEIVIGTIVGFDDNSQPQVDFQDNPQDSPQTAVSTQPLYKQHIGRQAAILFANGEPEKPVIIGLIHNPLYELLENYTETPKQEEIESNAKKSETGIDDIRVDGKRVVIEGHDEIVLKCGASSITLTKEGKILIRGKYLVNRSTGVNRILGGSVQIN